MRHWTSEPTPAPWFPTKAPTSWGGYGHPALEELIHRAPSGPWEEGKHSQQHGGEGPLLLPRVLEQPSHQGPSDRPLQRAPRSQKAGLGRKGQRTHSPTRFPCRGGGWLLLTFRSHSCQGAWDSSQFPSGSRQVPGPFFKTKDTLDVAKLPKER